MHTMIRFILLPLFLMRSCSCQLKQCWNAVGALRPDLPCDPNANVSACCAQGYTCATNFYCNRKDGIKLLGTCTDITWHDTACPLPLDIENNGIDFDQNTTACDDGTFCPQPNNTVCCSNHQGNIETFYHYNAPLPSNATSLSEYYAANGYHIPTTGNIVSNTMSINILSASTRASLLQIEPTTPPSTSATNTSQIKPNTLPSLSTVVPSTHPPGLNSSAKAGLGVGISVGTSTTGLLLYFTIRRLRRRSRRRHDLTHSAITLTNADVGAPGSTNRYEKPELTGEDARREMDGEERRRPELTEDCSRIFEMDDLRQ